MLVYGRAHRIPHHGSKSVVDERQLRRQRMRSKRHSRCEINCRNPATPLVLLSPRLIFARSACTSNYVCACESTNDSARELITSPTLPALTGVTATSTLHSRASGDLRPQISRGGMRADGRRPRAHAVESQLRQRHNVTRTL